MPAMLQDGRVIVVVFAAFLLIETNLASSENGKCRHCKELIQSLLASNNLFRLFQEKSSFAEKFSENVAEYAPVRSKLDSVVFCLDNCIVSGDKTENDENNSGRSKRDTEGIYKYFSPPFSQTIDDQFEQEVPEVVEEPEEIEEPYESSRRAYPGYVKDRKVGSNCDCVREQEESVKRLVQKAEKYTERVIEFFRAMIREEVRSLVLPERQREISNVGHQQNYFMISILMPDPSKLQAQFMKPGFLPAMETTTAGQTFENPEPFAMSQAYTEPTIATTEMPQESTEPVEEATTEWTIDYTEVNVMRQGDDQLPPDCETKDVESSQYLPALLQAFRPENT